MSSVSHAAGTSRLRLSIISTCMLLSMPWKDQAMRELEGCMPRFRLSIFTFSLVGPPGSISPHGWHQCRHPPGLAAMQVTSRLSPSCLLGKPWVVRCHLQQYLGMQASCLLAFFYKSTSYLWSADRLPSVGWLCRNSYFHLWPCRICKCISGSVVFIAFLFIPVLPQQHPDCAVCCGPTLEDHHLLLPNSQTLQTAGKVATLAMPSHCLRDGTPWGCRQGVALVPLSLSCSSHHVAPPPMYYFEAVNLQHPLFGGFVFQGSFPGGSTPPTPTLFLLYSQSHYPEF